MVNVCVANFHFACFFLTYGSTICVLSWLRCTGQCPHGAVGKQDLSDELPT